MNEETTAHADEPAIFPKVQGNSTALKLRYQKEREAQPYAAGDKGAGRNVTGCLLVCCVNYTTSLRVSL